MPKDDNELVKKRPHEVDAEDEDFDEMIGKSREEEEDEDEEETEDKWDAPRKAAAAAAKRRAAGDESDLSEEELEAASKPVFGADEDDEDPLDAEDEDDERLPRRKTVDEPTPEEDLAPKPTFKYNAPPPPSEEPTIIGERTLDDLSEEDLESRPTFKVDRGVAPDEELEDERPSYPRPVQNEPMQESEEEFGFQARSSDNLEIPGIRKPASGPYPPHRNLAHDYDPDLEPDYQPVRPHQNPMRGANNAPYAPDQNSRFGGYKERNGKGASVMHIVILLLIGGAVIAATVYLLQNQFNFPGKPDANATPAPTPLVAEATPAPTPTPAPLERSQFKVRVLNGTTTAGLAGQTMTKLKGLGYQSDKSGNAPKQDYTTTVVRTKDGEASLAAQLTKDLAPDYNVASISADLKDTDTADAEIILGK